MGQFSKKILIILLLILVGLGGFYLGSTNPELNFSKSKSSENDANSATKKFDSNAVDKKLKNIKSIIDSKFLYDYDEKGLEEGIYKGFVASLKDTYTEYYTASEYKALNEQSEGSFGGVGIEVSAMNGQYIEVVAPIKGTPADKAGIKTGDKIIAIDNKEFLATELNDAVKVMRGEPGKEVTLTILRDVNGKSEKIDFKIIREIINVQSIHAKMMDNKVGYIHITNFQANTAKQFFEAFEDLKKQGAEKLVFDLRNNPGGLLDVTLEIADFLLGEGDIMSVKYKDGSGEKYSSDAKFDDMPMVTLINGGSASASEIMSGALKDFKRSEIVGENTFGKGVVQQIIPLNDGTGVKVTISEFFTPDGNKIHGVGIAPTVEIKLNEDVTTIGPEALDKDNQLQKALEIINK